MIDINVILNKSAQKESERKIRIYSLIFRRLLRPIIADQQARFMQRLPLIVKPTYKSIMEMEYENHVVSLAMRPIYIEVATESADELLDQFKVFVKAVRPEKLLNQKIFDYADKYSVAMAKHVNKTTARKIKREILDGFKENLSYRQMAKKIETNVFKDLAQGYRSRLIARTEAHGMVENGSFEAAKASHVAKQKTWSSAGDARVTHGIADGQTVLLHETFVVGGFQMNFPGDTTYGAALGEIIHCRCSVLYSSRIDKKKMKKWKDKIARLKAPPPKLPKLPRRGHLGPIKSKEDLIEQFVKDAKLRGKVYSDLEATEICQSVRNFSGFDYARIRDYQMHPLKYADDIKALKHIKGLSNNLETYLKYSAKYSDDVIHRGIDLTSSEFAAFKKGKIISMRGTSSFSSSLDEARVFGDYIFHVKNQSGVSVSHISAAHFEQEILMAKGIKFKILRVSGKTKEIFLKEIIPKAIKPKVLIPKLKPILERGHLGTLSRKKQVEQIIMDAKKAGIKMTEIESEALRKQIHNFTSWQYRDVRGYQARPEYWNEVIAKSMGKKYVNKIAKMAGDVDDYIKFAPKYNGNIVLRNIQAKDTEEYAYFWNLKSGSIIDMKGTSFWTSSDDVSSLFGNIQFVIKNPKTGVSVNHLSKFGKEAQEVLFGNKAKFKVIKVKDIFLKPVSKQVYSGFTIDATGKRSVMQITLEEIVPKVPKPKYKSAIEIREKLVALFNKREAALNKYMHKAGKAYNDWWEWTINEPPGIKEKVIWRKKLLKLENLSNKAKRQFAKIKNVCSKDYSSLLEVDLKGFPIEVYKPDVEPTKRVLEQIKEFSKLIDEKLVPAKSKLGVTQLEKYNRPFYDKGIIHVAGRRPRETFHELGHWLEDINPEIKKKVQAFYVMRTKGKVALPLKLSNFELAKDGGFIDPYMGKFYKDGRTEILSMGLEYFYKDPVKLATKDPEFFEFIYNLLRGI